MPFTHLHVHTGYSLLDGASRIDELLDEAKKLGMDSIAITDHGAMYGVIEFYQAAMSRNIKPIIGCEVYTAPRSRFDKTPGVDNDYSHLVLLAKNNEGYQNLMFICSCGFTEGFYYKPRVDMEVLKANSNGIIALSACLAGDIPKLLLNGDYDGAKAKLYEFTEIFGKGNFYLEMQDHTLPEQKRLNPLILKLAKETDTPLVCTNDIHYVHKKDAEYQDVLLCIQTAKTVDEENRMKMSTNEFYLKSEEEMAELFPYAPEAGLNTHKIAEQCEVTLDFDNSHLPKFDVPEGKTSEEYLRSLCSEGLIMRYGENVLEEYKKRLDFELDVISSMGYTDYFLIVWDFIRFARSKDIMVGPGRGSAAGSMVAYTLTITDVDPMRYNLLFERFLNPERISMPDIDIDFCYERRSEVIDYVIEKYGEDHVAQIITFGTMAAKAAVRDVGRALGMSYAEVDIVAKMIPFELKMTINRALEVNPKLKEAYDRDLNVKKLLDTARALEGLPRHSSTHAAGVVITDEPVYKRVPVQTNDSVVTTQYPMGALEKLGVLKMDFLGLRTLTVIRDAVLNAKKDGIDIDMSKIDYDLKDVYAMIARGETSGVFQLESRGMTSFMKELSPSNLEDIIAGIALYRPGPMDSIPRYIKNKNNPKNIKYKHEKLESILDVTYGCIVYQEQVMQIVRELAGYSLGRADLVRRAMSKKKADVMEKERKNFIYGIEENGIVTLPGAVRLGIDKKAAGEIFDEMIDFANYAFNKSHATVYAVIAYQTAYLKHFYPAHFMAALLTSEQGNAEKVAGYIAECSNCGIKLLMPDINKSYGVFTVENGGIRFAISAVKNVGRSFINECVEERKNGLFLSLSDFCTRMRGRELNKRAVEGLIKCGAFDFTGGTRAQLMSVYENILDGVAQRQKNNIEGQLSIFGDDEMKADEFPDIKDYDHRHKLTLEKEATGLYMTGHPLDEYRQTINSMGAITAAGLLSAGKSFFEGDTTELKDGEVVRICGIIVSRRDKTTKNNSIMSYITLEDLTGAVNVLVFPKVLKNMDAILHEDAIIVARGKVSFKEEVGAELLLEEATPLSVQNYKRAHLNIDNPKMLDMINKIIKKHRGDVDFYINYQGKEIKSLYKIDASEALKAEISSITGENSLIFA